MGLAHINQQAIRDLFGAQCLTKATLDKNAVSAATIKSTGTISFTVDGRHYTHAALSAQAFTAGHAGLAIGQTGYYAVTVNAAGTIVTYEGIGQLPDVPAGVAVIGLVKVVAASAVFTPGTTLLDAAGITVTYHDTAFMPSVAP